MDWNNINKDRDTRGLGPIEYDQTKVPALIRKHADDVRTKTYGQEVREAQARNAEVAGLIASEAVDISNETKGRQDAVETQFNSVQQELTDKDVISAPEIIAARNGEDTLSDRLASDRKRIELTPDDFKGTDLEKLQQALDFAILNNLDVIHLNRLYDITGGTIYMPVESFWGFLTFEGGHIRKDDAGFIFNRNVSDSNKSCNSPMFINTKFSSESDGVYLYNGNRMIRQNLTNCIFDKVGLAVSDTYLQSVRLSNCETGQLGTHFVDAKIVYDLSFDNLRGESSTSPDYHLIKVATDQTNGISYVGLRITNSLIEGYARINPISIGTGYGLKIDGTYFEANNGDIKIDEGVGTSRIQGSIRNCAFNNTLSTYVLEFGTGLYPTYLAVENNTSDISSGQYFSNRDVFKGGRTNNLYSGGALTSVSSTTKIGVGFPYSQLDLGKEGVSFEIPLINLSNVGNNLYDLDEKQFLVNFKFTFASSSWYTAHLSGILSIDGLYTGGVVKQELLFTELSERNTSGNVNGGTSNEPVYDYYFKETNTKNADSTGTPNLTVVFKFPNGKYATKNHASFMPIRRILGEYRGS